MKSIPHLSQQIILITGASAGIGAALALTLAQRFSGIRLILSARRQNKLESVAENCRQAGAEVAIFSCDLADSEQVQALAREALAVWGRIDSLVNNAGYGQMAPLELTTPAMAQRQFAVNFHAPLILSQSLIPAMRSQGRGRIVNISSLGGRMAFPTGGLYSCSKFALEALSDVLRMELGGFNIQVSVVEPGPVITEFFEVAWHEVLSHIPTPEATPYAPAFGTIETIDRQLQQLGWAPEKVACVILKALSDSAPRPRYLAATGGRIMVPLMTKWLPTAWCDRFWKRFYGIDRVEKDWQSRAADSVLSVESI